MAARVLGSAVPPREAWAHPGDTLNGTLSAEHGLEQLYATRRMVTPDGIRLGSTLQDVRAAYARPSVRVGDLLVVRASDRAVYRIQVTRVVAWISLDLRQLTCTR